MVGDTLSDIRTRIEELAATGGAYCVVCARTGTRPVPVVGRRFPDRASAAEAAEIAATYRATLRRWDPRAPCYDFIACEVPAVAAGEYGERDTDTPPADEPTLTGFCHDVAAAVLEALSARGHDDLESAVMEAYCASATVVGDPDDLCLHLLRTLALELDARLAPARQRALLREAADGLTASDVEDPVPAAMDRLEAVDLVDRSAVRPAADSVAGHRSWTVTLAGYALSARGDALPTLPVAVAVLARLPGAELSLGDAVRLGERSWQVTLTVADDGDGGGLMQASVTEPV